MVDNDTDIHTAPAPRRRLVPGWDYWALTLLGAPLVACAVGWLLLPPFHTKSGDYAVVAFAALLASVLGWIAPSVARLAPGARAFWSVVTGLLSIAVPVAVVAALIYAACHSGGCFS